MSAESMQCPQARLEIGADPQALSGALAAHLAGCDACSAFRTDTLELDARLREALAAPLSEFRRREPRVQKFALAASVVLALVVAGGFWMLRPSTALAGELIEHVSHEPGSWESRELLPDSAVAGVLRAAGVQLDAGLPVVYAMACPFRGHSVPHLVVQTDAGPLTIMLLAHEKTPKRREFSEQGYRGVLWPAGAGSVAILARTGEIPAALAAKVVSGVRWQR